jgi:ketosteroid isomerase-like protein
MSLSRDPVGVMGMALAIVLMALPGRGRADEEDAVKSVRAVLDRQVADWNKGDLDGFLAGYWNSPKVVFQSGGQRYDGWEAMRDRYKRRYQAEGRAMGQLVFSGLDVEPLGSEAVLARGRWQLTMPDGTKPGGLFTVIFRKFPEGWKIVHDHTSADDPKPAEANPASKKSG